MKVQIGALSKVYEREGDLLAYGNPLLDISVNDPGCAALLEKYGLKANDAILAEEKHVPLYQEMVDRFPNVAEFLPGGATLNAMRAVQWILQQPRVTTFIGCISKDKFGSIITDKSRDAGVNAQFQYTVRQPTGTCGVLCTGSNRSLVANLAAANCFSVDFLDDPFIWKLVEKAKVFYTAGFPLTVSPESMLRLATHSMEAGKTFCMNLSAAFLCSAFKEPMVELLPFVDILFGNETEAEEFARVHDYQTTDKCEIAKRMASWTKQHTDKTRLVVITQGPNPVIVVEGENVAEYPVTLLSDSDIIDTNGAGDGFVGGFLAQYLQGKSVGECVRCGIYVGNIIIQQPGFTLPASHDFV